MRADYAQLARQAFVAAIGAIGVAAALGGARIPAQPQGAAADVEQPAILVKSIAFPAARQSGAAMPALSGSSVVALQTSFPPIVRGCEFAALSGAASSVHRSSFAARSRAVLIAAASNGETSGAERDKRHKICRVG